MGLGRKVGFNVTSVVFAMSFIACNGSSNNTPKCTDKDVQSEVIKDIKGQMGLMQAGDSFNFMSEAYDIKLDKITTKNTNDEKKMVTCSASITMKMNMDKKLAEKIVIEQTKDELSEKLKSGEKMTDANFEKLIKEKYGSMKAFDAIKEAAVEMMLADKNMNFPEDKPHEFQYTAQRTDDGKLSVRANLD